MLANELNEDGSDIGPVTTSRCDVALENYFFNCSESDRNHTYFITSAGMARPDRFPAQKHTLGEMQRRYLEHEIWLAFPETEVKQTWCKTHLITAPPEESFWGTRPEIMTGLKIVKERESPQELCVVAIVTSSYHMRRAVDIVLHDEMRRLGIQDDPIITEEVHIIDSIISSRLWEIPKSINERLRCLKPERFRRWNRVQPFFSPF